MKVADVGVHRHRGTDIRYAGLSMPVYLKSVMLVYSDLVVQVQSMKTGIL
jgi:hypothetical protein